MNKVKMTFKDWDCELVVRPYMDPPLACIQLNGAEGTSYEHEPIAIATCNLPEQREEFCDAVRSHDVASPSMNITRDTKEFRGPLPLTFIKDYSENEGMLNALFAHDICVGFNPDGEETKDPDDMLWFHNGFISAPLVAICNLTLAKQYREAFSGRKL